MGQSLEMGSLGAVVSWWFITGKRWQAAKAADIKRKR
jgi:hypothetical protein